METTRFAKRLLAIIATGMTIAATTGVFGASAQTPSESVPAVDYRIEVTGQWRPNYAQQRMRIVDTSSLVFIRLIRASDGAPLTNADVALSRVDMAPDGMGEMTAHASLQPMRDPGAYRVSIRQTMAGRWAVTIAARAAGQSEPVLRTVTVTLGR